MSFVTGSPVSPVSSSAMARRRRLVSAATVGEGLSGRLRSPAARCGSFVFFLLERGEGTTVVCGAVLESGSRAHPQLNRYPPQFGSLAALTSDMWDSIFERVVIIEPQDWTFTFEARELIKRRSRKCAR